MGCKIYLALNLYKSTAAIGALRPLLTYAQVKITVQFYTVYYGHFGGFECISIILEISDHFSHLRDLAYFSHFRGLECISVILDVLVIFKSF